MNDELMTIDESTAPQDGARTAYTTAPSCELPGSEVCGLWRLRRVDVDGWIAEKILRNDDDQDAVRILGIAVPPPTEPATIVSEPSEALLRAAAVASTTRQTQDLLRERREAVIAAAVTWRLNVEVT